MLMPMWMTTFFVSLVLALMLKMEIFISAKAAMISAMMPVRS